MNYVNIVQFCHNFHEFFFLKSKFERLRPAPFETDVKIIQRQLKQKRILVVYSELHESINIVPAEQFTE